MEIQPKKLLTRLLEAAAVFALAMFLIRLGVCYLSQVWWILLILAGITIAVVIGWRFWKHQQDSDGQW